MKIGALAKRAGTTTRTVRFYEEVGLIKPSHRTSGGFRCYSELQLRELQMILSLKELGFDLEQIKHILAKRSTQPTGGNLAKDVIRDLQGRLEALNDQIERLSDVRSKVMCTIDSLCECLPCEVRLEDRLCDECEKLKGHEACVPFFHTIQTN